MSPRAKNAFRFREPIVSSQSGCVSSKKVLLLKQQRSKLQGLELKLLQMNEGYFYNYERHHLYFHASVSRLANLGNGRSGTVCRLLVCSIYYILAASTVILLSGLATGSIEHNILLPRF